MIRCPEGVTLAYTGRHWDAAKWVAYFAVLGGSAAVAHVLGKPWVAFALFPVPLLLFRIDSFRLFLLLCAGNLCFFQVGRASSNAWFLPVPDAALMVFLLLLCAAKLPSPAVPRSRLVAALLLFSAYGLATTLLSYPKLGLDLFLARDVRNLLLLWLVFLFVNGTLLAPKRLVIVLLCILAYTAIHGLACAVEFAVTRDRVLTWNEIFFPDAILIGVTLFMYLRHRRVRTLIVAATLFCGIGLVTTQTRSTWISCAVCLFILLCTVLMRSNRALRRQTVRVLVAVALAGASLHIGLKFGAGIDAASIVSTRMGAVAGNELVNPYSSLGYRIYESYMVWRNRTWLGHGPGARLHLFFTQIGGGRWMDWWSIHSGYFDLLHKYGFVGLGLYLAYLCVFFSWSLRMTVRGKGFTSAIGTIAFTCMMNHALVSITSPYLIRENVVISIVLMVGMVDRYYRRMRANERKSNSAGRAQPASVASLTGADQGLASAAITSS